MKGPVIVLMCLLHAARSWHVTQSTPSSACNADRSSCRCCLMVRDVNRMAIYINDTLNAIEDEYKEEEQVLNKIIDSRTAFSAALDAGSCVGFFSVDHTIIYNRVFINLGEGYNATNGIFTVPHCGVYGVAVTIFSDAGSPGAPLVTCANLMVNSQVVAGTTERNMQDQEDSITINLALHLMAGDHVAVSLPSGCYLCDNDYYNTFSVFLIYPTQEHEYA